MKKIKISKGFFRYTVNGEARKAPYSEKNFMALQRSGYDVEKLLTLGGRLKRKLYKYQLSAVVQASTHNWNLLIAFGMGTGKTLTAEAIHVASRSKKTLLIVPANIMYQWERSLKADIKSHEKIKLCEGLNYDLYDCRAVEKANIVICNYVCVSAWQEVFCELSWDLMILDESQKIKKDSSNCTRAVRAIKEHTKSCICLSGTPLTDRNSDIYNSVMLVNPTLFPSRIAFEQRYCGGTFDIYGRKESINTLELHDKLISSGTMVRRTKSASDDIKRVTIEIVPMNVGSSSLNMLAKQAMDDQHRATLAIGSNRGVATLRLHNTLEKYLQEATRLKLPSSIKWIENFLSGSDEKLVVACVHREQCSEILYHKFNKQAVLINGSVTSKQKDKLLMEFVSNPKKRLLIGNINSVATGIDGLQKVCSNLVVIELCWSPADLQQLFARLDRTGQVNPVTVSIHTVLGSLDEMLAKTLDKKAGILSEVLDGKKLNDSDKLINLIGNLTN